mmetsp:Transcript_21656/g.26616  ORF Transcript_21656/g.26616 Transcript_21656/m.26616 type:complete len:159 (-) Transcript_21656:1814-2290(-)
MNYPCTVTNPLLKKHQMPPEQKRQQQELSKVDSLPPVKFSNHERPVSCPQVPLQRPFSSSLQSGMTFKAPKLLGRGGADKISSASLMRELESKQKLAASASVDPNVEGSQQHPDSSRGHELLNKPSLMEVAESVAQEENGEGTIKETKTMGLSAFKAT